MGSATPYMLWTSNRVYTGVTAGTHQFAVQCFANQFNVVLPGSSTTSIASLTVFEIQ